MRVETEGVSVQSRLVLVTVLLVSLLGIAPAAVLGQTTTLQLVMYGSNAEAWQGIADAFHEANPDILVEVQLFPYGEYPEKILVMFASGNPPDLFQTWAQYKSQWVHLGLLDDVTDRWKQSNVLQETEIYPFMLDAATYKDRIYGVPYDYNTTVYFVNRDLLSQAGFDSPAENWNVDDMRDIARKITDETRGTYGVSQRITSGGHGIQWYKNWTGQGWLNNAGDQVLVNTPEALDMLNWWHENLYQYDTTPRPGSFPARGGFDAGGHGLHYAFMNVAFNFPDTLDWEMALFPAGPAHQGNFAQGHLYSMAYNTPHKEAAWRFLEWMASYEGQKALVELNRRQPSGPYEDLWDLYFSHLPSTKADEVSRWVMGTLYGKGYADNMEYWLTYPEMNSMMSSALNSIFNQNQPITNVMDDVARLMQLILDESEEWAQTLFASGS